jgi:hypothetical protein
VLAALFLRSWEGVVSGDDREAKLRELAEKLEVNFDDYYVYTTKYKPKWVARFDDIKIEGRGDTIARAEDDLITKIEKYLDEGELAKPENE